MTKVLYIGQCEIGSTSRIRYEVLNNLSEGDVQLIDVSKKISTTNRIFKSIGWRFQVGPLIWKLNKEIKDFLANSNDDFDIVWIDKGVFIYREVLIKLKTRTKSLVHYTPDTAFLANGSRHFRSGIQLYDFLITTKSFELDFYLKYVERKKIIYTPQGYNPKVHFPRVEFAKKNKTIAFIGLYEPYRAEIIKSLLTSGFHIVLGGVGWKNFLKKQYLHLTQITYLGQKVVDDQYALAISSSKYALGLLSKKFPELHTTRTFEIPACGTCLITEENEEINNFFSDDACLKFRNIRELHNKLQYLESHPEYLEFVTKNGLERNKNARRDYPAQISEIFKLVINNSYKIDTSDFK